MKTKPTVLAPNIASAHSLTRLISTSDRELSGSSGPVPISLIAFEEAAHGRLQALIGGTPTLRLASTHAHLDAGLDELPQVGPRVMVIDADHLAAATPKCLSRLSALVPDLQILVLGTSAESKSIVKALLAGAAGYVLKSAPMAELSRALFETAQGGVYLCQEAQRALIDYFRRAALSASREVMATADLQASGVDLCQYPVVQVATPEVKRDLALQGVLSKVIPKKNEAIASSPNPNPRDSNSHEHAERVCVVSYDKLVLSRSTRFVSAAGFKVLGSFPSPEAAARALTGYRDCVVVIATATPNTTLSLAEKVKFLTTAAGVVVYGPSLDAATIFSALVRGAAACVFETSPADQLERAVEEAAEGRLFLCTQAL